MFTVVLKRVIVFLTFGSNIFLKNARNLTSLLTKGVSGIKVQGIYDQKVNKQSSEEYGACSLAILVNFFGSYLKILFSEVETS